MKIFPGGPTPRAVHEVAYALARYATTCQEAGLVPIIEPEVLTDGSHDIERCLQVQEEVWAETIKCCADLGRE